MHWRENENYISCHGALFYAASLINTSLFLLDKDKGPFINLYNPMTVSIMLMQARFLMLTAVQNSLPQLTE